MTTEAVKKRPFFLRIWFFIALGVSMMLSAAALQYYSVGMNNRAIEQATMERTKLDALIEQTWQQVQTIERKKEILVLVASAPKTYGSFAPLVSLFLSGTAVKASDMPENPGARGEWLVNALDGEEQRMIERINMIYGAQQKESAHILMLKQRNERTGQLALFLQMFGLMLVMLKDIARFW